VNNYGGGKVNVISQLSVHLAHDGQECQAAILVQKGTLLDLLLGTDVLPKLGCSVVLPQGDGNMTDLLQGCVWDKSQCSSQSSLLQAEAPSFIPAVMQGMTVEVDHSNVKSGKSSTSQLCAEVESLVSESELKSSEFRLSAEVKSVESNSEPMSSESQLCAGVECIESNSELKSTELQLCAEVGSIETNSTLTSGNFGDSQLSAELESNSYVTSDVPNEFRSLR